MNLKQYCILQLLTIFLLGCQSVYLPSGKNSNSTITIDNIGLVEVYPVIYKSPRTCEGSEWLIQEKLISPGKSRNVEIEADKMVTLMFSAGGNNVTGSISNGMINSEVKWCYIALTGQLSSTEKYRFVYSANGVGCNARPEILTKEGKWIYNDEFKNRDTSKFNASTVGPCGDMERY